MDQMQAYLKLREGFFCVFSPHMFLASVIPLQGCQQRKCLWSSKTEQQLQVHRSHLSPENRVLTTWGGEEGGPNFVKVGPNFVRVGYSGQHLLVGILGSEATKVTVRHRAKS